MKSLKQIVENYMPTLTKLGDEDNEKQLNEDIVNIRKELTTLIKANNRKVSTLSIVIISVMIICAILVIIFSYKGNLSLLANICTVTGIAPLTLVGFIKDWWKDKTNANTLLHMIDSLNKESFHPVLVVFANMLKK